MSICLPQQCLALVYGLPPPGDPLFRESPGWWVRLQSVGHRHKTCSHVFVPESFESIFFRNAWPLCMGSHPLEIPFQGESYMSTPAMPGPLCMGSHPLEIPCSGRVQGGGSGCRV